MPPSPPTWLVYATLAIASYAAIVSTASGVVSYLNYRDSGARVRMWYKPPTDSERKHLEWPVVITIHNAGRLPLSLLGFAVSYGRLPGRFSLFGIYDLQLILGTRFPLLFPDWKPRSRSRFLHAYIEPSQVDGEQLPFRLEVNSSGSWTINLHPSFASWLGPQQFPDGRYAGPPLYIWAQLGNGRVVRSQSNLYISGSILESEVRFLASDEAS